MKFASEYGMQQYYSGGVSTNGASPKRKPAAAAAPLSQPREKLGTWLDLRDGFGERLLLTDEEIRWVCKNFFLMQLARDEFVVRYSIKGHVSP